MRIIRTIGTRMQGILRAVVIINWAQNDTQRIIAKDAQIKKAKRG